MMTFQATGTIRELPESQIINGKNTVAFVLVSDNGSDVLPIYVKDKKLIEKLMKLLIIGTKVECSGEVKTTSLLIDGKCMIRPRFFADNVRVVKRAIIKFKRNIIFSKLLDVIDLDNLYKLYKTKGEENG